MASSSPRSRSRALLLFFWTWCAAGGSLELQPANAQDCNHNGVADAEDLAQGASMDCDRDGIPDECEAGFPGEETTSTGWGPVAVIASDLDGDGRLDLATANSNSNDISVLLGNGDGSFKAQLRFAVGLGPGSLVASDLNGDGRFDIVTANLPNLSVLLGNGDGTFQAPRHVDAGLGPAGIIATDFDGATLVTCTAGDASGNQSQCVFRGRGRLRTTTSRRVQPGREAGYVGQHLPAWPSFSRQSEIASLRGRHERR